MSDNVGTKPLNYAPPETHASWWVFPAMLFGSLLMFVIGALGFWWFHIGLDRWP